MKETNCVHDVKVAFSMETFQEQDLNHLEVIKTKLKNQINTKDLVSLNK